MYARRVSERVDADKQMRPPSSECGMSTLHSQNIYVWSIKEVAYEYSANCTQKNMRVTGLLETGNARSPSTLRWAEGVIYNIDNTYCDEHIGVCYRVPDFFDDSALHDKAIRENVFFSIYGDKTIFDEIRMISENYDAQLTKNCALNVEIEGWIYEQPKHIGHSQSFWYGIFGDSNTILLSRSNNRRFARARGGLFRTHRPYVDYKGHKRAFIIDSLTLSFERFPFKDKIDEKIEWLKKNDAVTYEEEIEYLNKIAQRLQREANRASGI
jgi:hypothetical protein